MLSAHSDWLAWRWIAGTIYLWAIGEKQNGFLFPFGYGGVYFIDWLFNFSGIYWNNFLPWNYKTISCCLRSKCSCMRQTKSGLCKWVFCIQAGWQQKHQRSGVGRERKGQRSGVGEGKEGNACPQTPQNPFAHEQGLWLVQRGIFDWQVSIFYAKA